MTENPDVPATAIDDIHSVDTVDGGDLVTFIMVCGGVPCRMVVPNQAAAKLWIGLANAFRRDGRTLEKRRRLVQDEFSMTVSLLQAEAVEVQAPDTPSEQFALSILLDGGLIVDCALPEHLIRSLSDACQKAMQHHASRPASRPN